MSTNSMMDTLQGSSLDRMIRSETSDRLRRWFGVLEFEKTIFVLVNLMDIVMTFLLLQTGVFYESNPLASFIIDGWGFVGVTAFKLTVVALVMMIANIIAWKRVETAQRLLYLGIAIVGSVVIYSVSLLAQFNGWM